MFRYSSLSSPLGTFWVAIGPYGIVRTSTDVDELAFYYELEVSGRVPAERDADALKDVATKFEEYFAGRRRSFDIRIDLSDLSPWQRAVLEAVAAVPYGTVRSYGEIAWDVGKPQAARAVGTAVATSPISIVVPCHRIIHSDGTPGEYASRTNGSRGARRKLMLLALEGVEFGTGGKFSKRAVAGRSRD